MYMYLVSCPVINEILDGTVDCEFESNITPSVGDTCNFTCNTGYELTGSDTRTCQSDGSWSSTAIMCRRSTYVYLNVGTCLFMCMLFNSCLPIPHFP